MYKINDSLMEKARAKSKSDFIGLSVIELIVIIICVATILNTFVFFNVLIEGPSMEPTMYTGDVLIANRYKKPTHGSIVIISGEEENGEWLIKRVIAMEGDRVEIRGDNCVYVWYADGEDWVKIDEPYIKEQNKTEAFDWNSKLLEEGEIFYLGDNRKSSTDSRDAEFSTCDISQIVGVVESWSFKFKNFNSKFHAIFS